MRICLRAALAAFLEAFRAAFGSSSSVSVVSEAPPSLDASPSAFAAPRAMRFAFFLSLLQRFEHVVILSQSASHFFRHVNGRLQTRQSLVGRL